MSNNIINSPEPTNHSDSDNNSQKLDDLGNCHVLDNNDLLKANLADANNKDEPKRINSTDDYPNKLISPQKL